MNELHDYKILFNKADPNKEDNRLHEEKYKVGIQSSNKYLTHVCCLPSTDVGPEDASGKEDTKCPFSHNANLLVDETENKCPRKMQVITQGHRELPERPSGEVPFKLRSEYWSGTSQHLGGKGKGRQGIS